MTLPRISTGEAQALSALARHGQNIKLHSWTGEGELHLSLQLYNEAQGLLGQDAVRLDMEWAGASVQADFAPSAMDHWLRGPGLRREGRRGRARARPTSGA